MKKSAAAVLLFILAFQLAGPASAAAVFTDVPETHWAAADIERMSGLGVIDGVSPGRFEPGREVTRAEYVKLLIGLGRKTGSLHDINYVKEPDAPYEDVSKNAWYYPFIVDAYNRGMLAGGKTFLPDQPLTREDMALMTGNFYRLVMGPSAEQTGSPATPFADMNDVSPERRDAVVYLAAAKLVGGTWNARGELVFAPKNRLNRAEAAVMTARVYDRLEPGPASPTAEKTVLKENGITFTITRQENNLTVEADMGERATGGYSVRILRASSGQDAVNIQYEAVFPKTGDMVTQAFTHPKDMLAIQLEPGAPKSYKLIRAEG